MLYYFELLKEEKAYLYYKLDNETESATNSSNK